MVASSKAATAAGSIGLPKRSARRWGARKARSMGNCWSSSIPIISAVGLRARRRLAAASSVNGSDSGTTAGHASALRRSDPRTRVACEPPRPRRTVDAIGSLEDLLELQALDSAIDRLLERRTNLPALARFQAAHRRLEQLKSDITAAEAAKRELDLAESRAEGEMRLDEDKVQREEQRLFAGIGLTAKDLTHLRDEVAMLRERISKREDEALALIEQQQATADRLGELAAQRAGTAAEKAELEAEIAAAWKEIDAELAGLETRKAAAVRSIDPDLIALYEELRPLKEGVAAAPLTADNTCGGCHLKLSAAEQIEVQRSSPPRCLHCRRILVLR